MATTNFDTGTVIQKEWLNDADEHIYDQVTGLHAADNISVTPAGNISSTDVQAALEELDTDKAASSHSHSANDITSGTLGVSRGGTGQTSAALAAQALLDAIGATQGDLLYYNGTDWVVLAKGTAGQQLMMNSGATAPEWATGYPCKAWVSFDGTRDAGGSPSTANTNRFLRGSGNVASVLRNGTGDYTITFTSAFADANYAAVLGADNQTTNVRVVGTTSTRSASSIRVTIEDANSGFGISRNDSAYIDVAVFR